MSSHPERSLAGKCCKHRATNRRLQSNEINKFINDHFNTSLKGCSDRFSVSGLSDGRPLLSPPQLIRSHASSISGRNGRMSPPPLCRSLRECMHACIQCKPGEGSSSQSYKARRAMFVCSTRWTTALTKETGVKGESRCLPSRTEWQDSQHWRPELILRYKPGRLQNFHKIQKPSKSEYQCFCLVADFNIKLCRFYKVEAKLNV